MAGAVILEAPWFRWTFVAGPPIPVAAAFSGPLVRVLRQHR